MKLLPRGDKTNITYDRATKAVSSEDPRCGVCTFMGWERLAALLDRSGELGKHYVVGSLRADRDGVTVVLDQDKAF